MKKILLVISFFGFLFSAYAQVDITKKPEPLAETTFKFPDYSIVNLSNGLKVFIVPDNEQPTIAFSFLIQGGSSVDGSKSGISSLLAELLTKGAGSRNALQFAQTSDGIGAGIGAGSNVDYMSISGSGLKKNMQTILDLMSDMILKPAFSQDEFDKLIPLMIAGLQDEKSRPMSVASRLIKKIMYGENHPYGKKETEASLKSIKLDDIKEYFKTYFKPNNTTLVVYGNITEKEIVAKLEKSFANWKSGEVPKIVIPKVEQMPLGVYFIKRPASVQSTISVVTKGLPAADDQYQTLSLAASLMGSSFGGRLFRTLREKHSYTYTPFGMLGQNKYFNSFVCGADVRNAVTDSALDVIKEQMKLMASEPATEEELNRIKKYEVGEYQMSFENGGFIGGLLQMADFHKIPFEKVKAYPQIISSMNPYEIQRIAEKYMNPEASYIVVVGNQSVREKLDRFGKVYEYDLDLNPASGEKAKMEKVSMNAKELINKYTDAIGGKEAVANTKTIITEGTAKMTVQGKDMEGTIKIFEKYPNKMYQSIDLGMIQQKIWVDGTNVLTESFGNTSKLEGKELEKRLAESKMFKETELASSDNKCEVLGKQGNEILLKVNFKDGEEKLFYFDAVTYLINKIESSEETPQGPMPVTITFGNYAKAGGVMLPKLLETTFPMFTIKVNNSHKVNEPIEDSIFSTEKK